MLETVLQADRVKARAFVDHGWDLTAPRVQPPADPPVSSTEGSS
jgi:hypothetical protein